MNHISSAYSNRVANETEGSVGLTNEDLTVMKEVKYNGLNLEDVWRLEHKPTLRRLVERNLVDEFGYVGAGIANWRYTLTPLGERIYNQNTRQNEYAKTLATEIIKHLPGKHQQKKHGHGKLGLQDAIDEAMAKQKEKFAEVVGSANVRSDELRVSRLKRKVEIDGRTVLIEASVSGADALQKIFGKKSKVILDDLVMAYTGGLEDLPKGTTLKITLDADDSNSVDISGRVQTSAGAKIADFERTIGREGSTIVVEHNVLEVSTQYQGDGYGSKMFYTSEEAYRKMGVDRIETVANIDVGGYAWARMGFEFAFADERSFYIRDLEREVDDAMYNDNRSDRERNQVIKKIHGFKYPFQLASFVYKDKNGKERQIGKEVMLKSSWNAVKYLKKPKSPAVLAGNAYRRIKMRKLRG